MKVTQGNVVSFRELYLIILSSLELPMLSRSITKESDRVFLGTSSITVKAFRDEMVNGNPFGLEPQSVFQTTGLQRKIKNDMVSNGTSKAVQLQSN
jgi:hypothetical protein